MSGAVAQNTVVVVVNGDPITAFDIEQRTRFHQLADNKIPARQEVLDELIDEKLKLQLPKRYDFPTAALDNEVETTLKNMAKRQRVSMQQFTQSLASHGVQIGTLRSRVRAEMIWSQIIRSKYQSAFQVNENDILKELENRNKEDEGGFDYTLRPIIFIVPRGSLPAIVDARKREAEGLRMRFENCDEGVPFARALRDIAVLDLVKRSSADLPPQLRSILEKTEIGHLTPPEITTQGVEFYALCAKKPSSKDNTPGQREVRNEIYSKQFQIYSKRYLKELREQAYIVYK
jgi:peptidyl-prolyl cis-trans isomerase SurA